jgi:hypothetical protein
MKLTIANGPLNQIDDWDDFVATRYKPGKSEQEFRTTKPTPIPRSPSSIARIWSKPDLRY